MAALASGACCALSARSSLTEAMAPRLAAAPPPASCLTGGHRQDGGVQSSSPRLASMAADAPRGSAGAAPSEAEAGGRLDLSRRHAFLAAAGACLAAATSGVGSRGEASAAVVEVGKYLPKASDDGFVVFTPASTATPALRAGNVSPYTFYLPPTWKEARIANIMSGNYCQPKCAEPWTEVKFEDPSQGMLQVIASPMVRLTNKPNSTIEEIGDPEKIISALGPFVTGDSYDSEEVVETKIRQNNGQTYYTYALETPYARSGAHNLAAATAKGNVVLLLVVSASDSQWSANKAMLRKLVESFSV
eukprot:SM000075S21970  [mRNA]  locus=s75:370785:372328:- [translate_table: standard]